MNEIKTTTPTGKEIIINFDGGEYVIHTLGQEMRSKRISVYYANIPQLANEKYPVIEINEKMIACEKNAYDAIQNFISVCAGIAIAIELENLNNRIPGYTELKNAYEYRYNQFEINERYMDRLYDTSIASGERGDVENADSRVDELEKKYEAAKYYISWVDADPSSDCGYQKRKAAEALYNGVSLVDAKKIANDFEID